MSGTGDWVVRIKLVNEGDADRYVEALARIGTTPVGGRVDESAINLLVDPVTIQDRRTALNHLYVVATDPLYRKNPESKRARVLALMDEVVAAFELVSTQGDAVETVGLNGLSSGAALGWRQFAARLTPSDFSDSNGTATLERIAQLAVTPTGEVFGSEGDHATVAAVTAADRLAAIGFLTAFLTGHSVLPGFGWGKHAAATDALVPCAADVFERFDLLRTLYHIALGDATAGESAKPPENPLPSVRQRTIALGLINSLVVTGFPWPDSPPADMDLS
jgi:hypothetical protein